ncbi:MAG: ATP-dependent 6-phosphofructokinase [Phycisphaerae bacterium]|nr:ATP-dependent 6-phosphofructokinase [Phycisphaerae bacterium]
MSSFDFAIPTLGPCTTPSPIHLSREKGDFISDYVSDVQRVVYQVDVDLSQPPQAADLLEAAGPREMVYFDPAKVGAAIVTCGGLCPGLNDVIRSIVLCLWHRYGVRRLLGIRYGYRGFLKEFGFDAMAITLDHVRDIHKQGGTILGSSRGYGGRTQEIVDFLEQNSVNQLFVIGGDGTQRGALAICQEVMRRGSKIAIVGIPKTIDNDLSFVQRSFGFETSVSLAVDAVAGAHIEAAGAYNGIGLVKLMGRESGFIAAQTALACNDVNFVLIPEVPFVMQGENGFLNLLESRLKNRHHAVIVVSEGAGQHLLEQVPPGGDASGNKKLGDVGVFLKREISQYFKSKAVEIGVKYIDPSYIIRSAPANANDSVYCTRLGAHSVHAAMSGRTGLIVSLIHDRFVHVPIKLAVSERHVIDPEGSLWRDVIEATGQPGLMSG